MSIITQGQGGGAITTGGWGSSAGGAIAAFIVNFINQTGILFQDLTGQGLCNETAEISLKEETKINFKDI